MKSRDRAALDRLIATAHLPQDGLHVALDATIRPARRVAGHDAPTLAGGEPRSPTRTGPYLPSITLAEATSATGPMTSTSADLLVTTLLGEGGMGVVHGATQRSLERSVAVKRPLTDAGDGLVEEARTMARVEHPNVVPVHALGRDARDRPVLVMKRVQGASLRDLLRDDTHASWPMLIARWGDRERATLGILGEVADALQLAHARGIVHRDVKPENVMVGEFGEVYLLDWGIARRLDEPALESGNIVGTPGYMAPEMVLAPDDVDARTDVYLLGATLHEILTKTLRHRGSSLYETLGLALESAPVEYASEVPEDLAALANRATSLDRTARPESAAAFRTALREHERHHEALGLVRDARETLAPLVDRSLALSDAAAMPRLSEAGAALAAALRAYPEGASVRTAREAHLELCIERDLALESPSAARAHLAQLDTPRPELAARIDALDAALTRAKTTAATLAAARAESDTSSTLRVRTILLVAAFVPVVLATILVRVTGVLGGSVLTPQSMMLTDGGMLALLVLSLVIGRRRLFANRGNRTLSWFGVCGVLALPTSNALGLVQGESPAQALSHTYIVLAYGFGAGGLFLHPRFAVGALTSFVIGWLLAVYPDHAILLSTAGMAAGVAAAIGGVIGYGRRQAA